MAKKAKLFKASGPGAQLSYGTLDVDRWEEGCATLRGANDLLLSPGHLIGISAESGVEVGGPNVRTAKRKIEQESRE